MLGISGLSVQAASITSISMTNCQFIVLELPMIYSIYYQYFDQRAFKINFVLIVVFC